MPEPVFKFHDSTGTSQQPCNTASDRQFLTLVFFLLLLLLLLLLKKTDLTCRKRASRTGYKVSRNSTTKYRMECSYRLYEWL